MNRLVRSAIGRSFSSFGFSKFGYSVRSANMQKTKKVSSINATICCEISPPCIVAARKRYFERPQVKQRSSVEYLLTKFSSSALLGTAFKHDERERLGLRGLLPHRKFQMNHQVLRFLDYYKKEDSDIRRFNSLQALQDRNETLFYRVVIDNIKAMAPIVYTPTVGKACQEFSASFREARGLYFSLQDTNDCLPIVYNWMHSEVDVIVVTVRYPYHYTYTYFAHLHNVCGSVGWLTRPGPGRSGGSRHGHQRWKACSLHCRWRHPPSEGTSRCH